MNVLPPIVSAPERAVPVDAATVNDTSPLPVPAAGENWIHGTLLDTVHAQPDGDVTLTFPSPPAAGTVARSGEMANEHPDDCVTETICPATTRVAFRAAPVVDATVNVTLPFPLDVAGPLSVIHGTLAEALQVQPAGDVTLTVIGPPAEATECASGATLNVQPWPWATENVSPATRAVPDRDGPLVGATVNATLPGPVPPLGEIVIQLTLLPAVHGHPAAVVTAIDPLPPAASAR